MAEDGGDRRIERPVFGVSPPTPTASSAGPTVPVQGNSSIDWHGLAPKKASISGNSAGPPRPAVSTSTAAVSGSSSHRLLCRPWDCGDLLRRLSTFKISFWNQAIGPASCARKGWVNVDVDLIACEGCDRHLRLEAEAAPENFREQLETAHQASCPWKGNSCAESLAQFPSSAMALIGGYNDRCDALLQLHSLPLISAFAVDQMKLSRGPQIERLLSQPPAIPGMDQQTPATKSFSKAQRLISLCGWEPRFLPCAADFEDHSAQSTRNACLISSHKRAKRSSMPRPEKEESRRRSSGIDLRYNPASTLLECIYCGANVNILRFQTVSRPPLSLPSTAAEYPVSENRNHTLVRGTSAASGIRFRHVLDGGDATTSEAKPVLTQHSLPKSSASNLHNLAAARAEQTEGSEMGDCCAASYESRGPPAEQLGTGQGESQQFRAESGGGTNDAEDEGKSCAAESSKRKRRSEGLAADQHSLGMAVSGNATSEQDAEGEVGNDRKNKRVCIGPSTVTAPTMERTLSLDVPGKTMRGIVLRDNLKRKVTSEFPCSSSVNATDTCFQNKMENSMDSVEFMPQDEAHQHTAASGYTENEWLFDEPNSGIQGQQSTSYAEANVPAITGGEKSDTNAVVISTGTATAGGGSVGMIEPGPGSQRVQSSEADVQGADFSEHQMDSVAGEADVVIDPVDQGLVCDSTTLTLAQDGNNDSREGMLSLCPGLEQNSTKDTGDESGESGSKAAHNRFPEEERTIDTTNALITGCSVGTATKEATDGSVEIAATHSPAAARDGDEFDPVRSHQSFCPWINGLVLAAANGTFGGAAVCGWQLTIDALELQESTPAGVTESESTASMCKGEASKRMFAQGSSSQQCNGSRLECN